MRTAEELYIDQAPVRYVGERIFTAIYPHSALKKMHWDFVVRLGEAKTREDLKKIERDLRDNPHLHQDIIDNLLRNVQDKWENFV